MKSMKHMLSIRLFGPTRQVARAQIIDVIIESLRMYVCYAQRIKPLATPQMITDETERVLITVFDEMSTRTRCSHEEAAHQCGFHVGSPLTGESSSLGKHESWTNTMRMLRQYGATALVIRSTIEGLGLHLAQMLEMADPGTWVDRDLSIIVGGAGTRDHPTQVLLDLVTIVLRKLGVRAKGDFSVIENLLRDANLDERIMEILDTTSIAFVGDLLHSRVVHDWVHLGQWFDVTFLFVAPERLQLEPWCRALAIRSSTSQELRDSLGYQFVYTIRLQKERLSKMMPEHEAVALIKAYRIGREFVAECTGEILDAQPLDSDSPMIDPELWNHPRVIMFMQSAVGIPTRMAILRLCDSARFEEAHLLQVPSFTLRPNHVLKRQSLDEHWEVMLKKYKGDVLYAGQVRNGVVVDRLDVGTVRMVDMLLEQQGVYDGRGGPVLPGRNFPSASMREKEVLFLHDRQIPWQLAQAIGIIAPHCRFSVMSEALDRRGMGGGYRRIELPLPSVVAGAFRCPNANCITRKDPEAKTFFRVVGKKGESTMGLDCAYCETHFSRGAILRELMSR